MENRLYILWTNDNVLNAEHMILMYSTNAMKNQWWEEVTVIIWGATSKLVAENSHIQDLVSEAKKTGVKFTACESCAENLGTKQKLLDLGIEVKQWGEPLTKLIKNKESLITI